MVVYIEVILNVGAGNRAAMPPQSCRAKQGERLRVCVRHLTNGRPMASLEPMSKLLAVARAVFLALPFSPE